MATAYGQDCFHSSWPVPASPLPMSEAKQHESHQEHMNARNSLLLRCCQNSPETPTIPSCEPHSSSGHQAFDLSLPTVMALSKLSALCTGAAETTADLVVPTRQDQFPKGWYCKEGQDHRASSWLEGLGLSHTLKWHLDQNKKMVLSVFSLLIWNVYLDSRDRGAKNMPYTLRAETSGADLHLVAGFSFSLTSLTEIGCCDYFWNN